MSVFAGLLPLALAADLVTAALNFLKPLRPKEEK